MYMYMIWYNYNMFTYKCTIPTCNYSIIFLHVDSSLSTNDYNAWPITFHKHKCVVNDHVPMWIEMTYYIT